jgi:dTDP-4-amino-4,6-dideoxygalactose transaminase
MSARRLAAYSVHVPSADWTVQQLRVAWSARASSDAVIRLEDAVSRALDLEVIATGSARTALYLLLKGSPPARLLVPAFTCVAVPNAAVTAGVPVEWVDIDGFHLAVDEAAKAVRDDDAVLIQHTFGIPHPDASSLRPAFLIEDRAHRFDSADVTGDAVVFSLEHSKVFSAGRGGLLWVRDPALRRRVRAMRDELPATSDATAHRVLRTSVAQRWLASGPVRAGLRPLARRVAYRIPPISVAAQEEHELEGVGIKPTQMHPLNATVGLAGLASLSGMLDHRRRLAELYAAELGSLVAPAARNGSAVVRMPIQVEQPTAVRARVREHGIDLGNPWFNATVHPAGSVSTYVPGSAPVAEAITQRILNLPLHGLIDEAAARRIARLVAASA